MMGVNTSPFACRCSERLASAVNELIRSGGAEDKSDAAQIIIAGFLQRPTFYSKLDIQVLREPLTKMFTTTVQQQLLAKLSDFAHENGCSVSEAFRMAVFQELIVNG